MDSSKFTGELPDFLPSDLTVYDEINLKSILTWHDCIPQTAAVVNLVPNKYQPLQKKNNKKK